MALFVARLNPDTRESELRREFERYGEGLPCTTSVNFNPLLRPVTRCEMKRTYAFVSNLM